MAFLTRAPLCELSVHQLPQWHSNSRISTCGTLAPSSLRLPLIMLSLPTRSLLRSVHPNLTRAASTRARPQGLSGILQKNSDDVVITFAKRTAVGRAKKGQWKDTTVDELLRALFKVRSRHSYNGSALLTCLRRLPSRKPS